MFRARRIFFGVSFELVLCAVALSMAPPPMIRPMRQPHFQPPALVKMRTGHETRLKAARAPVLKSFSKVRTDHQALLKTKPKDEVVRSYVKEREEHRIKLAEVTKAENKKYLHELEHLKREFKDKGDTESALAVAAEMELYAENPPMDDIPALQDGEAKPPLENMPAKPPVEPKANVGGKGESIPTGSVRISNRKTGLVLRNDDDPKRLETAGDYYKIRCEKSGRYLAIREWAKTKDDIGPRMQLLRLVPDSDSPPVRWKIEPLGNGFWSIMNRETGKCLEVRKLNSPVVRQSNFRDGDPTQEWKIESVSP